MVMAVGTIAAFVAMENEGELVLIFGFAADETEKTVNEQA